METSKEASVDDSSGSNVDHTFSIRELRNVRGVKVYKVVSGSTPSLEAYNRQQLAPSSHQQQKSLPGQQTPVVNDWKALYTQFRADHALGTVPYRWERGKDTTAWLLEVSFLTPLHILVLQGPIFHESNVSGEQKAALIKKRLAADLGLTIDKDEPLMQTLGSKGMVVMIRETAIEWELVVSHELLEGTLQGQERVVAGFQRHPQLPVTSRWCTMDAGDRSFNEVSWKLWVEGETDISLMPDLSTDFLCA